MIRGGWSVAIDAVVVGRFEEVRCGFAKVEVVEG
jgi:hypothetical protein